MEERVVCAFNSPFV